MLIINNVKLAINEDESKLKIIIEKKLKTKVKSFKIKKKSLDARKTPIYVYSVVVEVDNENNYLSKDVKLYFEKDLSTSYLKRNKKCIVVGYGPSGIFSAYRLVEAGYEVTVIEKGKRIAQRSKDVEMFFSKGILNENSNVQFGEGGAGTFSDAKLTTRIKSEYIDYILDILIKFGANESIKYENHPHIGTDKIREIITKITDYLISKSCSFKFEECFKDLMLDNNRKIIGIKTDKNEYLCDYLLLGTGHSSFDTYQILKNNDVYIEKKDIAIGFRVEHARKLIDKQQTNNQLTEANEYFLRYKGEKGVYSFCMCPGGFVIPAMSDLNTIVTNGMSYADRDNDLSNSAILIQIPQDEFDDGYTYLKELEKKAFDYSHSYKALSQNIKDFMINKKGPLIFDSSYPLGTVEYDFNEFFTLKDSLIIKDALRYFDCKIKGFIDEGIMIGPETRSSCPIRIKRNLMYQSINTKNLFPMAEGSGYGGGIMSCAIDGIKVANAIISLYE